MQVTNISQGKIDAAHVPLDRLADNPQLKESEKLAEVSRQFEAILLRQIFSAAQRPLLHQENSSSSVSGIYQDMITTQLADAVSHSGGLGLARSVSSELGRQLHSNLSDEHQQNNGLSKQAN